MRHIELDVVSIEQVLDQWFADQTTGGLIALLPEAEKDQLPILQRVCRERSIPLFGGIFPALIDGARFINHGVCLLPFPAMPPAFLIPAADGAEAIGLAVRRGLATLPAGTAKPTLFLMFDGMLPNIASLLEEIYFALANRVDYAGVNAGSESFQPMPCLFDQNQLIGAGVMGVLLPGDVKTVLEHGFVQPERAMSATASQGNRVVTIDWRPAFEVYQAMIKTEYGIDLTAENFYQYAVHFPFGILRASGEIVVRIPVALADDGSLFCVGEVPENSVLVLLKSPEAGGNACLDRLAKDLNFASAGSSGHRLLAFYCAGRRMHLGVAAETELAELCALAQVSELAGALSLGEIGSTQRGGYPVFHNATLVCRPWSGQ
jgi:hypothetical protein